MIEVDDQTGANQPILIQANVLQNSQVVHRQGNLIKAPGQAERQ